MADSIIGRLSFIDLTIGAKIASKMTKKAVVSMINSLVITGLFETVAKYEDLKKIANIFSSTAMPADTAAEIISQVNYVAAYTLLMEIDTEKKFAIFNSSEFPARQIVKIFITNKALPSLSGEIIHDRRINAQKSGDIYYWYLNSF
jgi:hypothetical protein